MKAVAVILAATSAVNAWGPAHEVSRHEKRLESRQSDKPAYEAYTFDQLIDHFPDSPRYAPNLKNATFKQRYFFDSSYYKPGGPVLVEISGETSGERRFSYLETGIIQILMEATNGLGVILENRYYGDSYPFNTSTTDELRYLTTEQTIADTAYFAQHAVFPGIDADLTAPGTPWILYGGSLAGAQTAYSVKTYPDILWGGIASSGTTKAKLAAVEWYDPIQKYGPQDCIGSLNGIVDKIDYVFSQGNASQISHMKSVFGLEALKDDRDFAMTIAFPMGGPMFYPTYSWQELNWNEEREGTQDFWLFCSNITSATSPHHISQIDYSLAPYTNGEPWTNLGNYASYIKNYILTLCPHAAAIDSTRCFGTQNQAYWADPTNSDDRSYVYSTCTEAGAYPVARQDGPSLLSRVVREDYTQQWCTWAFPDGKHNKIPASPELDYCNKYGGYDVIAPRLAHIDGDQDPWLSLCYHSPDAPPRRTKSAEEAYLYPQLLISGGGHHWDSNGIKNVSAEPQFIRNAHQWEIRVVKKWLEMFKEKRKYP